MSDVPSSSAKIQVEGLRARSATSEGSIQAIGAATNYCLDRLVGFLNIYKTNFTSSSGVVTTNHGFTPSMEYEADTVFTATNYCILNIRLELNSYPSQGYQGNAIVLVNNRVTAEHQLVYDGQLLAGFLTRTHDTIFMLPGDSIRIWNSTNGYGTKWALTALEFNFQTG